MAFHMAWVNEIILMTSLQKKKKEKKLKLLKLQVHFSSILV